MFILPVLFQELQQHGHSAEVRAAQQPNPLELYHPSLFITGNPLTQSTNAQRSR